MAARMIACRTLGPIEVSVNGAGAPAALLWRKNLALLVYLARSPKRARARDHLIGLLWGDKAEQRARQSLNEALRTLRRYLGAGLESDTTQVRLLAGAVDLDTDRLETLAAQGDYEAAAALVRGHFLEGFSVAGASGFDDWVGAERAAWSTRCVDVLLRRVEQLLAGGALGALASDRAGALERFEGFAARLASEVGTMPDAETQTLAERIRRERTWRLPARGAAGEAGGAAVDWRRATLVGRAPELASLLEAWATCRRAGRAAVGVVEGDAGMGKTRLVEEVVARARLDGAAVALVRSVESDLREPWSGLACLARDGLLRARGVAGAPPAALTALRDTDGGAARPAQAFAEVLRAVVEEASVVMLVDDAAWCDAESLGALSACARDLAGWPLFLLFTTVAPALERCPPESRALGPPSLRRS